MAAISAILKDLKELGVVVLSYCCLIHQNILWISKW